MPNSSLEDVLVRLRRQVSSDLALGPLCTRVMLRTGVNLRAPRPDQVRDGAVVGKVLTTLGEMGYAL
jgi:hypothetical protein